MQDIDCGTIGHHERERIALLRLYAAHPHCFGTLDGRGARDAARSVGGERYERIIDLGFDPARELLVAAIAIARPIAPLAPRVCERDRLHIRFYVDQGDGWEDAGAAAIDGGEAFDAAPAARTRIARHCATRSFSPRRGRLGTPELHVRAILSYGTCPPANEPMWRPAWGQVSSRGVRLLPPYETPLIVPQVSGSRGSAPPALALLPSAQQGPSVRDEERRSSEAAGPARRVTRRRGRVGSLELIGRGTGGGTR